MTWEEEIKGTKCEICFHKNVCINSLEGPQPKEHCLQFHEEPKQGEWIPFEWDENFKNMILLPKGSDSHMEEYWAEEFVCSVCGNEHHWSKYCPNCGARMKEGDEK